MGSDGAADQGSQVHHTSLATAPGIPNSSTVARDRPASPSDGAAGGPGQDLPPAASQPDARAARRLSVTAYVEWVLGTTRSGLRPCRSSPNATSVTGALLAHNPWNIDFGRRSPSPTSEPARRHRHLRPVRVPGPASQRRPAAAPRAESEAIGIGGSGVRSLRGDPAQHVLVPNQEIEVTFLLGQGRDDRRKRAPSSSGTGRPTRRTSRPKSRPAGTTSSLPCG